jgi:starch-binding outer membrane protein, SusD/RagB family
MNAQLIYYKHFLLVMILAGIFFTGCKKYVSIDPPVTGLIGSVVYSKDATAIAAVNSIFYNTLIKGIFNGSAAVTSVTGLASDELKIGPNSKSAVFIQCYKNKILPTGSVTSLFWGTFYEKIYKCNEAIEGLTNNSKISLALKNQLLGEAKFLRAFFYFYAINLYGDVPLVLTTDYKINSFLAKTPSSKVWEQITSDLIETLNLLPADYYMPQGGTSLERILPVKSAASALLARIYLYREDWANAVIQSTKVIDDPKFALNINLSEVFKKNSTESIWQLGGLDPVPANPGLTTDGAFFILKTNPDQTNSLSVYLTDELYNAFTDNDKRKTDWVGTYSDNVGTYRYAYKYKTGATTGAPYTEYLTALRLSEQYLIRAEANARLNKPVDAANDLNEIRERAGLLPTTTTDANILLTEIAEENRKEFFCEWGHRWFDLKRTKTINQIMPAVAVIKETTWKTEYQLLPVPQYEILSNPNMTQNDAY